MSGVNKLATERNQRVLLNLVNKPGNDVCADCKARAPRWASHNLGIFLCVNCASVHRKIGTHVTKVKSLTMDSWTREQVEVMRSIGNVASNAKYNPDESRYPPPANREDSERDSELEKYIRAKYEFRRFMARPVLGMQGRGVAPPPAMSQTIPPASLERRSSPLPPLPSELTSTRLQSPTQLAAATGSLPVTTPSVMARSSSLPPQLSPTPGAPASHLAPGPPVGHQPPTLQNTQSSLSVPQSAPQPPSTHPVWGDLMSLAPPPPGQPGSSVPSAFATESQLQQQQLLHQQQQQQLLHQQQQQQLLQQQQQQQLLHQQQQQQQQLLQQQQQLHQQSLHANAAPFQGAAVTFSTSSVQFVTQRPTFAQQPTGLPGQILSSPNTFSPNMTGITTQSPYGQPFSQSYYPGQQQQPQSFAPATHPQQYMPGTTQPSYSQQMPLQGGVPLGYGDSPLHYQQPQAHPGQTQFGGQWRAM